MKRQYFTVILRFFQTGIFENKKLQYAETILHKLKPSKKKLQKMFQEIKTHLVKKQLMRKHCVMVAKVKLVSHRNTISMLL